MLESGPIRRTHAHLNNCWRLRHVLAIELVVVALVAKANMHEAVTESGDFETDVKAFPVIALKHRRGGHPVCKLERARVNVELHVVNV